VDVDFCHSHAAGSYPLVPRGCRAADLHFVVDPKWYRYYKACLAGFPGIGVYPRHWVYPRRFFSDGTNP